MALITEHQIETFINLVSLRHEEDQFQRIPLNAEEALLEKIRCGQYNKIQSPAFEKMDDNLGMMAIDKTTGYIYVTVTAIALFSRTAIQCGVEPDAAFTLSDALLLHLSVAKTTEEIHNIYQLSAVLFAKRVAHKKDNARSYQIDRACNYISHNIFHKITIPEIADYVQLSQTYLCRLFNAEMGLSLHNYIQREKIKIACNLLMHTDRPISEISVYIGFQSQSNFCTVFRKWQNMSPSAYRRKMYREVY